VHSNHAGIRSLAALAAVRRAGLPLVVTIHGASFTSPALVHHLPLARRLCAAASAVIANSGFTADAAREAGVDVPIEVIPLGVDTERYRPGPVDQAWLARQGLAPGRRRVLFAGWISRNKGPDLLLDAVERLSPGQRENLELLFVGPDRGYLTALRERAARSPLPVRIITDPSPSDYPMFYRAADVFVLPTRGYEGFGLVALEALASGCAVIGARLGGIPEAVGPAGLLFPPGNVEALAGHLSRLLEDAEELATVRARGPEEAAARTWSVVAERTAVVYRKVLGKG
jgi:glycosyltransferase involved in cell wall biosynthesis